MNYKIIIFDMDGTLYDLNDVLPATYQMQVKYLSSKLQISEKKAISLLTENNVYPEVKKKSNSATELFIRMGLNVNEWSQYRNTYFPVESIDVSKAADNNLLAEFSMICPLVLLSSNSYGCIQRLFSHIGCRVENFAEIICSDHFKNSESFSKKRAMLMIKEKYSIISDEMLSIGDRYKTDILPMLEIGGSGILLKSNNYLSQVYDDLNNNSVHSCEGYEFYSNNPNLKL